MKKPRGHLLVRIFFTYLLTAILVVATVGLLFFSIHPQRQMPKIIERNIAAYLEMFETKLKQNPSPEGIQSLYDTYGVFLRSDINKAQADQLGLPTFEEIQNDSKHHHDLIYIGRVRNYVYGMLKNKDPQTGWFMSIHHLPEGFRFPFVGIAAIFMTILALSFLTIRMIMSPIKVLLKGVDELSKGNLQYRIHTKHRNEFQVLAMGFNQMAERLEKMITTKERLLRDVSHELRSPLTRINVATDLIENQRMRDQIKNDVKKMDQMLQDLLESYRIRDGATKLKKYDVPVSDLISSIICDYQSSKSKVTLTNKIGPLKWSLDPFQIERTLRNLIENSIKYSRPETQPIEIILEKNDSRLQIIVQDEGLGISQIDLPHIFEPFYRSELARTPTADANGFGLGLSICKAIVEAHGGTITVFSEPNKGSRFTIELPSNFSNK